MQLHKDKPFHIVKLSTRSVGMCVMVILTVLSVEM